MKIDPKQVQDAAKNVALVAGLLAIVLAPAFLLLQTPMADIQLSEFTVVAINLVLGFVMIISSRLMEKNALTSFVLILVASLPLIALGGNAGLIGGLFGLAAATLMATPTISDLLK